MQEKVFTQALGLTPPWAVERVDLDNTNKKIDLYVSYGANVGECAACSAQGQPVHDRRSRSWRHLHFFQFEAWIHCELPRIQCSACGGTTQLPVPWARAGSHFTLMFEALALTLAREMPVAVCARILGCSQQALWRLIDAHVERARALESHADVRTLGIDETACRRGHHYITLVHDIDQRKLLFATAGKGADAVEAAAQDLREHGGSPEAIQTVCMDMSAAYIAGVGKAMPQAAIAFDRFHVIQMANAALEQVRREELRSQPELKRTRWGWLKDFKKWTPQQIQDMHWLTRTRLKTARAWRLKEALRDIYQHCHDVGSATTALNRWTSWARRSRLEPMNKLAETLKKHWDGVLHAFGAAHRHNGYVEAANSLVQAAKARARGYGTTEHFIAMCYLIAGRLKHLPSSPFERRHHV
jgi:transposase